MNGGKTKTKRGPTKTQSARGWSDAWDERATHKRLKWLERPRLHTAIFERVYRDEEMAKYFADNGGKIILDTEKNSRVRDCQKVTNIAKNLGWSDQHLELFTQLVVAYTRDPSIENYLRVRKTFPDVDIQVASFGGMEAVYKLEPEFRALGIDPGLVAGGMDGVEPSIDALSLRILECIADREKISDGPGHIEKRRAAISDSMVAYLIAIMLESYDWNDDETFRVPASLIVLVRHQLCGLEPDLSAEVRRREHQQNVALDIGRELKPGEQPSARKVEREHGIPRNTVARWLADVDFKRWVETGRRWQADGKFERGIQAALRRDADT